MPESQNTLPPEPAKTGPGVKTSHLAIASFALSTIAIAAYLAGTVLAFLYPAPTGWHSPLLGRAGGLIMLLSFFTLLAPVGYFIGRRALRKIKASEGTLQGGMIAKIGAVAGGAFSILMALIMIIPIVLLGGRKDAADSLQQTRSQVTQYFKAREAYEREDFAGAFDLLKPLAEQGVTAAQVDLGRMYAEGRGVPRDDAKAVGWFRSAAEGGNSEAQTRLGVMFYEGLGIGQDDTEAVRWFRKAAEQDHPYAQNNLGTMYVLGRGLAPDDAEAVRWYRKAAEQDNAMAQNNLANMYAEGRGVPADTSLAVEWYFKAGMNYLKRGDTEKPAGCLESIRKYGKGNKLEKKLEGALNSANAK